MFILASVTPHLRTHPRTFLPFSMFRLPKVWLSMNKVNLKFNTFLVVLSWFPDGSECYKITTLLMINTQSYPFWCFHDARMLFLSCPEPCCNAASNKGDILNSSAEWLKMYSVLSSFPARRQEATLPFDDEVCGSWSEVVCIAYSTEFWLQLLSLDLEPLHQLAWDPE